MVHLDERERVFVYFDVDEFQQLSYLVFDDVQPLFEYRVEFYIIHYKRVWVDSQKDLSTREVHGQIVVTSFLVVFGAVLVLVLIDFDCKQHIADDAPQIDSTLTITASTVERYVKRLVPHPVVVCQCYRLQ